MSEVFVVNSGSSSVKYQVLDARTEVVTLSGIVDKIGEPGGDARDHTEAMRLVLEKLGNDHDIAVVGHRVVHGGTIFSRATIVSPEVERQIDALSALAPLHNPANLLGIRAAREVLGFVPHVAVFDTAFHQTLAPETYTYAIDAALALKHQIRRYGFHGTSYSFVSRAAAKFLDRPVGEMNSIILHLGNGASVCAIRGGASVETSMGMTPLEGLVMGTRSGDLDPSVLSYLHREAGLDFDALDRLLNRESGLLGLAGSSDMRQVQVAASGGDVAAERAFAVYCHRIRHYVGAYYAQLGQVDAIVFTAGVGENSADVRAKALAGLEGLGIEIDATLNESTDCGARRISTAASRVAVLVIPTNEELEIARQALAVVAHPQPR
jgi:acetate kinase